jgi:GT2 family glycosyltransferase
MKNFGNSLIQGNFSHANGQCFYCRKEIFDKIGFRNTIHGEEHDFVNRAKKFGSYKLLKNCFVYNYPRRVEKVGAVKLFFQSLYAGIVRYFKGVIPEGVYDIEWGKF